MLFRRVVYLAPSHLKCYFALVSEKKICCPGTRAKWPKCYSWETGQHNVENGTSRQTGYLACGTSVLVWRASILASSFLFLLSLQFVYGQNAEKVLRTRTLGTQANRWASPPTHKERGLRRALVFFWHGSVYSIFSRRFFTVGGPGAD